MGTYGFKSSMSEDLSMFIISNVKLHIRDLM